MPTEKFKALVHFIIDECGDPARLGAVQLNKICWYADVYSYKVTGVTISGERYVKRQMGPVPKSILAAVRELQDEGAIAVSENDIGARFPRREYLSLRSVNRSMLSDQDQEIVRGILSTICSSFTSTTISELSHDQILDAAAEGEEIPMPATLAACQGDLTDDIVQWADNMVAEIEESRRAA